MARRRPTREEIFDQLTVHDRQPFADVLCDLLEAAPEVDDLRAFAKKHPDRWAQGVAIFAKPAGYNDRLEVAVGGGRDLLALVKAIKAMSDAELYRAYEEHRQRALPAVTPLAVPPRPAEPQDAPAPVRKRPVA